MVSKSNASGAEPDDQHLVAGVRLGHGAIEVQRIPARQQAVDLEAPWKVQNIFKRSCFNLRNVDRLLFLKDAGLHAVIADAVAGAGSHWIINDDNGQRAHRIAVLLDGVHLRDFLFEGAAVQSHSKGALLEFAAFFLQPR